MGLSRSDLTDLCSAYSVECYGVSSDHLARILEHLSETKITWPALQEVLDSDRYPLTIMNIASKIGMIIPVRRRHGLETYRHFLENLYYYEEIIDEPRTLDLYEVYIGISPVKMLLRYRDQDLVQVGFVPGNNRLEALQKFIRDTLQIHGEFTLESNSRSLYSSKAKLIVYQQGEEECRYTSSEFINLFDSSRGVVWKNKKGFGDPKPEFAFNRLALHQLRQRILERLVQWRSRDGFKPAQGPTELHTILTNLEGFLQNEPRNDLSSYLGNPSF